MTPKVKWSLAATNWLSLTNRPVFYVLVIPLTPEHKQPSVICAASVNRSTSSAKSKTRGHGRHHCWFVNHQGCLGILPAGACCQSSREHWGWLEQATLLTTKAKRNKFPVQLRVLTGILHHATRLIYLPFMHRGLPTIENNPIAKILWSKSNKVYKYNDIWAVHFQMCSSLNTTSPPSCISQNQAHRGRLVPVSMQKNLTGHAQSSHNPVQHLECSRRAKIYKPTRALDYTNDRMAEEEERRLMLIDLKVDVQQSHLTVLVFKVKRFSFQLNSTTGEL